eukprot:m.2111 g.2111  ORF g.2111 m.2111 type:complete len:125 (+) comp8313_c0_seq2:143-517(+)
MLGLLRRTRSVHFPVRLLSSETKETPSGWKPPQGVRADADLGFFVRRSKFNNLPVYTDFRHGRSKKITIIRKVEGDLLKLADCVHEILPEGAKVSVNNVTSSVIVEGRTVYWKQVTSHLAKLGF